MPTAESAIAREVDSAFAWIGGISLVLLVGITLVMILFAIRFRRSRNPRPTQIEGNAVLEVTWIVIPTLLVLWMFFKGYKGFAMMRDVPEGAMVVKVEARQWFWTFNYPEDEISSDRLFVPVNTPIKAELWAAEDDVVHSLYLPAFRVKEDCVPGQDTYLWFQADNVGTYNIFCAEYCGRDHSAMITTLEVLSEDDYRAWVAKTIADKNKPVVIAEAMNAASEEIEARDAPALYATYCSSCHGPEGRGGLVEGARDFTSSEGWKRSPQVTDIYRTLSEGIDGTQMRAFVNLSGWDRFALAHYVRRFNPQANAAQSSEEEIQQLVLDYKLGEEVGPGRTIPIERAMELIAEEATGGR